MRSASTSDLYRYPTSPRTAEETEGGDYARRGNVRVGLPDTGHRRESQIWHIEFRWSKSANTPNWGDHSRLEEWLGKNCDKWVFQHECTTVATPANGLAGSSGGGSGQGLVADAALAAIRRQGPGGDNVSIDDTKDPGAVVRRGGPDAGRAGVAGQPQAAGSRENHHYQGYGHLREKQRPKALAIKANEEFRGIRIAPCSTGGVEALKKYAMKKETRVRGPWADKMIYMGQDLPTKLHAWQEQLKAILMTKPDNRTIHWIYDPVGNSGKTMFTKYMQFHHGMLTVSYGDAKNLVNLVYKNPHLQAYMFDLTRAKPAEFGRSDIYSTMESIKNGYMVNQKYETGTLMMMPPHVVVFSNQEPEYELLSQDRWKVWKFGPGPMQLRKLIPLRDYPVFEAAADAAQALQGRVDIDPHREEDDWQPEAERQMGSALADAMAQANEFERKYQEELIIQRDDREEADLEDELVSLSQMMEQLDSPAKQRCAFADDEAEVDMFGSQE